MYQTSIRNKKKHMDFQNNREITYKINDEYEEYGYIINMLGNCRVTVISQTGIVCIGVICGSLRKFNKRVLIEKGDIVVITKSSPHDKKVYINYKFNGEQTNSLIEEGKLSEILINHYNSGTSASTLDNFEIADL